MYSLTSSLISLNIPETVVSSYLPGVYRYAVISWGWDAQKLHQSFLHSPGSLECVVVLYISAKHVLEN